MQQLTLRERLAAKAAGIGGAFLALLAPVMLFAQDSAISKVRGGVDDTASGAGLDEGETDLATLIGSFISAALGLLGIILVVLIIYAGFLWMTAQGNEEKIKKAKGIITNAVIGMILIFAAYAITSFVIDAIETAQSGA